MLQLTVSFSFTNEAEVKQAKQENTKYGSQDSCNDWNYVAAIGTRTKNWGGWKQDNGKT